ncbi:MAG: TlpA disulfide reductase family protein [Cytophagales bacterium]|nr:TlpA disulfide reductase family protein [Cytophagales bacterium]
MIKKISLALLVLIIVASCELQENSQMLKIELHGKLQNADSIELITYDMLDYSESIVFSGSIETLRNKSIDITLSGPVFANLKIDETFHQIYLESGYDLKISMDNHDGFDQLKYCGDGAEINNYLEQSSQIISEYYRVHPTWFQMNATTFSNTLDSLARYLNIPLEPYDFNKRTLDLLKAKNEITLINLSQQHRLINADSYTSEDAKNFSFGLSEGIPSDSYFLELSLLDYAQVLDLFLRSEIQEPLFDRESVDELDSLKDYFPIEAQQAIIDRNFPAVISEFLRAKDVSYWLASEGISEGLETVYAEFKRDFEDSDYSEQLGKKYSEWLKIGKGQPAPEVTGLTINNDTISLSDLRGKVVYIDVWATWCAPCIKEFPYYEDLKTRLNQREDIAFFFVSVDDQAEDWASFIKEKETPKGIHIREAIKIGHPKIQEAYKMWGVPRYILIDQNGMIVDSNAPRPSSGKILSLINSL